MKQNMFEGSKNFKEAIKCIDKFMKLNPKNKDAWHAKGRLLERLGRKNEAKKCFKKAKELD